MSPRGVRCARVDGPCLASNDMETGVFLVSHTHSLDFGKQMASTWHSKSEATQLSMLGIGLPRVHRAWFTQCAREAWRWNTLCCKTVHGSTSRPVVKTEFGVHVSNFVGLTNNVQVVQVCETSLPETVCRRRPPTLDVTNLILPDVSGRCLRGKTLQNGTIVHLPSCPSDLGTSNSVKRNRKPPALPSRSVSATRTIRRTILRNAPQTSLPTSATICE